MSKRLRGSPKARKCGTPFRRAERGRKSPPANTRKRRVPKCGRASRAADKNAKRRRAQIPAKNAETQFKFGVGAQPDSCYTPTCAPNGV
ncbi:MAG: hypothetical protein DBX55_03650 [Verrucomicrobia bacterium]|nr:MAG: hypothetical protein DBX55_07600 [Verrucomicrobiota bacterium]PWM30966.1 MAG: hypothetical protein DBX55_03650 [Verrucomicrobiota bacterium]